LDTIRQDLIAMRHIEISMKDALHATNNFSCDAIGSICMNG